MKNIITVTALLSAFLSLSYAIWQKRTTDNKVRDAKIQTMQQKISTQHVFMHPTEEVLKRYTRKSCISIAEQIKTNTFSDDDYGNYSRECAIVVLKSLAKNMPENVKLSDYFEGKKETDK